jgi:hypothetical protein
MAWHLLANFSQIGVISSLAGHSAAATQGACHNFAINWISLMNEDPTATAEKSRKRMTQLSKGKGGGNPVLQAAYSRRWKAGDYQKADEMMIAIRGLQEKGMAIDYSAFNLPKFKEAVSTSPEYSGIIYSFWFAGSVVGASGGGHSIGFYRELIARRGLLIKDTDYTICFDPNFGEMYIPDAEFNSFYGWIVSAYGAFQLQMAKGVEMK